MIRVIQSFKDKVTGEVYQQGKELEIDDAERVKDLINRGLVVISKKKKK